MQEGAILTSVLSAGYYFEVKKTVGILGLTSKTGTSALPNAYKGGLAHHNLRYLLPLLLARNFEDQFRGVYLQGLTYSGFWRRLLTDITPLYIGFSLTHITELRKQQAIVLSFNPDSRRDIYLNWNWARVKSIYGSVNIIFNLLPVLSFFAIEKGLSELARTSTMRKNPEATYQSYAKLQTAQRIGLVPVASMIVYPLEVLRTLINQAQLEFHEDKGLPPRQLATRTYQMAKTLPLRGVGLAYFPYTIMNMAIIATLESFTSLHNPLKN